MLSGVGQFLWASFVGPGYVPVHFVVHRRFRRFCWSFCDGHTVSLFLPFLWINLGGISSGIEHMGSVLWLASRMRRYFDSIEWDCGGLTFGWVGLGVCYCIMDESTTFTVYFSLLRWNWLLELVQFTPKQMLLTLWQVEGGSFTWLAFMFMLMSTSVNRSYEKCGGILACARKFCEDARRRTVKPFGESTWTHFSGAAIGLCVLSFGIWMFCFFSVRYLINFSGVLQLPAPLRNLEALRG